MAIQVLGGLWSEWIKRVDHGIGHRQAQSIIIVLSDGNRFAPGPDRGFGRDGNGSLLKFSSTISADFVQEFLSGIWSIDQAIKPTAVGKPISFSVASSLGIKSVTAKHSGDFVLEHKCAHRVLEGMYDWL